MNTGRLGSGVAFACIAFAGMPATAQAQEIAEITVTARKVEESLKEVPLAITAFSGSTIEQAGITNLADVAALTPGLTFFNALGEFLPVPIIRGIAPTDIFGENNAAVFVDGVYVSGREGLNFSQLDLERIEVVKGPQSALYGRNAFSGAINYVTRRPTDTFELKTDATAGNDGKLAASAAVSGPLAGDWLKGRAAFSYDEWDGSYHDPLGGNDVGGYRYRSAQAGLLFTPYDTLDILLSGYYSNDEIDESASTSLSANCEDQAQVNYRLWNTLPNPDVPFGPRLANFCGEVWDLERTNEALNQALGTNLDDDEIWKIPGALGEDRDLVRGSLNVDWDVGFGTVSLLTGYSSTEQTALSDGTRNLGHRQSFLYCTPRDGAFGSFCSPTVEEQPALGRFSTGLLQVTPPQETDEISQEVRFTSPLERPFRYSVGAYYYDVDVENRARSNVATVAAPDELGYFCPCNLNILAIGGTPFVPAEYGAFGPWFVPGGLVDRSLTYEQKTTSWAGFGWVEQEFLERFTARVELRYTDEEKELDYPAKTDPSFPRYPAQHAKDSWDFWTGRLSLDYRVSEDWMIYGSVARGVKGGSFDSELVSIVLPEGPTPDHPFIVSVDEEKNVTMELGVKGTTADGRLGLDLALYRIDWSDIVLPQTLSSDPVTGLPFTTPEALNDNSGDATIWGWELAADLLITDNLKGRLGVSWTDATFDDAHQESYSLFPSFYTPDPACTPQAILALPANQQSPKSVACRGVSGGVSGNQLLRQSEWQGSATLDYSRPLRDDWSWFTRADVTYQDKWYVGSENQSYIPSHTYVNLRLGVESARWSVELWGRNLLEDDAPSGAFRDVYFGNTPDVLGQGPLDSNFVADFFPWRFTVTHPALRTYGLTVRARFGGAER